MPSTTATATTTVRTESELIQFGVNFLQSILPMHTTTNTTTASPVTTNAVFYHSNDVDTTCHHLPPVEDTQEYRDLMLALQRLELLHRPQQQHQQQQHHHDSSFLQHDATDGILLHIFSYLPCRTLVHTVITCTRWCHLTKQYAIYRTTKRPHLQREQQLQQPKQKAATTMIRHRRQLSSPLQLLQAYENILGIQHDESNSTSDTTTTGTSHTYMSKYNANVPIPILLPSQYPIRVTDCGDDDYNGIYYCTGCNGNGYIFTKPRNTTSPTTSTTTSTTTSGNHTMARPRRMNIHSTVTKTVSDYLDMADSEDIEISGQPLRCIIARRFSNEVRTMLCRLYILWLLICLWYKSYTNTNAFVSVIRFW